MKVYVQMDYLANQGADYLSASYRDFVPEESAIRRLLARHLKVVPSLRGQRIVSIESAIARKESVMFQPIRKYIENQIAAGENMTRSYFARKGIVELKIRKQNWFPYWKAIEEEIKIKKKPEEEVAEEYDDAALSEVHEWFTKEVQRAFSGFRIDSDYELFVAEEFTAAYKTRTFEFGLIRTGNVHKANVPYEETYYFIVYSEGKVKAYEMWHSHINRETGRRSGVDFDYMGFNMLMYRVGAWK